MPSAALAGNPIERFVIGYRDATTGAYADPNPKQALAHASDADELLYGGAAFGGKSEFAIWEAIALCLMYPGCDVAIFRRTHTELEHDLIERFLRYVPRHIAKYNDSKKIARFFNNSRLLFCYCHTEKDKYRYQSDQWTGLIIDQAEHFTESIALYLFSRVRTSVRGVRPRIRLTANPGGVGHAWLKARYIAPAPEVLGDRPLPSIDGEVWRPRPNPNLADDKPLSRAFIQAKMTDNRAGMIADPAYVARIRANPNEVVRRMLEDGDWDAFEGQMFSIWKPSKLVTSTDFKLLDAGLPVGQTIPWHVIPDPHWRPPTNTLVFGSVDYGYGNPWSSKFRAVMPDGHMVAFKEFYQVGVRDVQQAQKIHDWIAEEWAIADELRRPRWKIPYIVMDASMWGSRAEHGLAKSRAEVYVDILSPLGINRKSRLQRMLEALTPAPDGFPWCQYTTACPNFIRTLPLLITDAEDPDDILHGNKPDKKQEDHAYDDESYFLASRPPFPKPALEEAAHEQGPLVGLSGHLRAVGGGRR
jgi:hypothetical protein